MLINLEYQIENKMKNVFLIISILFLFFGLFGSFKSSILFASRESTTINVNPNVTSSDNFSIKDLDQFTAKENLRFTIRNAGGILTPTTIN
jgi:hypothetical protein